MLDFELLRAFVAVADCGGFHRAAERLNLTQSTVSQQIKRLEPRSATDIAGWFTGEHLVVVALAPIFSRRLVSDHGCAALGIASVRA
jgi:hypothetical protein